MKIIPVILAGMIVLCGCSIRRMAVNQLGNALAGGGGVFATDDDPELVRQAVPFGLKLQESLLAESPRHRGLLLSLATGFTQYAYAFVQQDADEMEEKDVAAAKALRDRARRLFLRARDYGLRCLELENPDFRKDPVTALKLTTVKDVPVLYWTAAAWGAAIADAKDRPEIVADAGTMAALMERALELDETFERGAIHSFLINYEMARPGARPAEAQARARQHFDRAVTISAGKLAGPFVTYAEAVCVQQQHRAEFTKLLQQALAVNADAAPEARLANLVMQRRARWLLAKTDELFAE
ncbi:MAG: TRAP transporter TatT component family protein [Verrucomicrobiota bacterium]